MPDHPDFWIEIIYSDGSRTPLPFFGSRANAEGRIRQLISTDQLHVIDFCLLLDGKWEPGTVASNSKILADAQGYYVKGAKRYAYG